MKPRRRQTSGVVQLELMFALLVMAMAALSIGAALFTLVQTSRAAQENQTNLDHLLAQNSLQQMAAQMPPRTIDESLSLVVGTANTLSFVTLPAPLETEGPLEIRVSVNLEDSTLSMATEGSSPMVLASAAQALRIRYWGRLDAEPVARWHESWNAPQSIPLLIKLEWQSTQGTEQIPLILEPGLNLRTQFKRLDSMTSGF